MQGTPQGLAVYVNGVRFNQAFGDTVNFDLLPDMAIDQMNLEGSNPVFGLNALGGALNVRLKNGFTYQGGEIEASGGSFGTFGGEFPVRQAERRHRGLCRGKRHAPGRLARSAIFRHREFLRRYRLARQHRRGAFQHPGGQLGAERAGHLAGRIACRRSRGAVHRAQPDQQPLHRRPACRATCKSATRFRCRPSPTTTISCSASPTATRRTTRHATTVRACCAPIPATARRSGARRSRPSSGRTRSRIPSWTTRRPTPTAMAPRSRRPTRRPCSASTTTWSAASASTAHRPSSPPRPSSAASRRSRGCSSGRA